MRGGSDGAIDVAMDDSIRRLRSKGTFLLTFVCFAFVSVFWYDLGPGVERLPEIVICCNSVSLLLVLQIPILEWKLLAFCTKKMDDDDGFTPNTSFFGDIDIDFMEQLLDDG